MVILNEHSAPPPNSPVYDFLYRPEELEDVCMWDQISLYEKVKISKRKVALADSDDEDEGDRFQLFTIHKLIKL